MKQNYVDISKAASELGYVLTYSLESGLNEVVEWFAKNALEPREDQTVHGKDGQRELNA